MSSSLNEIRKGIKQAILTDYLSGIDMEDIARKYGFKYIRTCYHHLQPLTKEQKIQRMIIRGKLMKKKLQNENTITN